MNEDEFDENDSNSKYTHEQKVVAAVWVHEKEYNNQTWKDIHNNFMIRFNTKPPNRSTLLNWEKKLFQLGNVDDKEKSGRPLSRLMHVPYVKASLEESPRLSLRERSKILGLPRTTLLKIIREDLKMEFEPEQDEDEQPSFNKKHAPYTAGQWKKREETIVKQDDEKPLEYIEPSDYPPEHPVT